MGFFNEIENIDKEKSLEVKFKDIGKTVGNLMEFYGMIKVTVFTTLEERNKKEPRFWITGEMKIKDEVKHQVVTKKLDKSALLEIVGWSD